jgi:hypothetical protein
MRGAFILVVLTSAVALATPQDRQQGRLVPGTMAADFTLTPRNGGDPITLSSFRGVKPVALVFGSYT